MTEHTDEPNTEPAQAPTAPQPPVADAPPPPVATPPFAAAQPYPIPGYAAPYPFAPVPKQPWFNPAKRTAIVISAIVAAIVIFGGGLVVGAVAAHHRDNRGPVVSIFGPRGGARIAPNGAFGPRGPRFKQNKGGPGQLPAPSASSATS